MLARRSFLIAGAIALLFANVALAQADPPHSWNDGAVKIGRRPIFVFGNSDGDLQMLQWTMAGSGARFAGIVHHTDAARELASDRPSKVGQLDKA